MFEKVANGLDEGFIVVMDSSSNQLAKPSNTGWESSHGPGTPSANPSIRRRDRGRTTRHPGTRKTNRMEEKTQEGRRVSRWRQLYPWPKRLHRGRRARGGGGQMYHSSYSPHGERRRRRFGQRWIGFPLVVERPALLLGATSWRNLWRATAWEYTLAPWPPAELMGTLSPRYSTPKRFVNDITGSRCASRLLVCWSIFWGDCCVRLFTSEKT